jgi:hypothetical protein
MNKNVNNQQGQYPDLPANLTEEELEHLRDMCWAVADPEVLEKYPDQIVAVYRRQIIAHGEEEQKVLDEAEKVTGLPRDKIAVVTIPGPEILWSTH